MQKRDNFYPVFFLFLFFSFLILGLFNFGILNGARGILERITSPLQKVKYGFFQKIPALFADPNLQKLTEENLSLRAKILDQGKLKEDNAALSDQFKTTTVRSYGLLPAEIIGAFGFTPGIFAPTSFTLNKGIKDGITTGMAVVYQDNLIGRITEASAYLSRVDLIINKSVSFAAKTESGALGVIKGNGEKMILDNVVLSQNLVVADTVLTYGDINAQGVGIPSNLVVGKVISVDKNASALFQKGEVKSILDFSRLTTVFIVVAP